MSPNEEAWCQWCRDNPNGSMRQAFDAGIHHGISFTMSQIKWDVEDKAAGVTDETEPVCRWYHAEGNESYSYFTNCGNQISAYYGNHCGCCGRKIQFPEERKI